MRSRNARIDMILLLLCLAAAGGGCGREAPSFAPGNLTVISTPPGAVILFDGVDTGHVTPHTFADLDADLYNVSVILPTYVTSPGEIPVDLAPLDDLTLEFTLSQTGLFVTSEPAGARILVDGTDSGQVTPATLGGLAEGPVQIALELDTYLVTPASVAFDVVAGQIDTLGSGTFSFRSQRTILLEGFANVDCGPCPQLAANLIALTSRPGFGPDRVLYLDFAAYFPNQQDPLYVANAVENKERYDLYAFSWNNFALPALYVDGVPVADALSTAMTESAIAADLGVDPGFRIDVAADFSNPAVPATVTLVPDADLDLTGHTLFVALYEKEIDFTERGLEPGSNGQTVFHHVFRDRVDVPPALNMLTAGVPSVYDVALSRGDWPLDNLVVVAFVQRDSDLAILQAGSFGESAATLE